jgi:hypothetical protein
MHKNNAPQTPGVYVAFFADDNCLYATDLKEGFVVRNLQWGVNSVETWCELGNIKINKDKTQGIYFSRSLRWPESHLKLNVKDIPIDSVKYFGVFFDKKITWRL